MTLPSDIPADIAERADILCDQFRHIEDDREFVARILMAVGQGPAMTERGGLTVHQKSALTFIKGYIADSGTSPSIDEIREHFGLASKSAAHRVVSELVERGAIATLPFKARSITIVQHVSTAHNISGAA